MIYILTGAIETGKTTTLLKWANGRKDVFGMLTPRDKDHLRFGLDVYNNRCFKMQTELQTGDIISVGRYRFLKSAFKKGNAIIKKALSENSAGYIIIDELGKLELQSKGLHESAILAIPKTISSKELHLILIIRESLLTPLIEKYRIVNHQSFGMDL